MEQIDQKNHTSIIERLGCSFGGLPFYLSLNCVTQRGKCFVTTDTKPACSHPSMLPGEEKNLAYRTRVSQVPTLDSSWPMFCKCGSRLHQTSVGKLGTGKQEPALKPLLYRHSSFCTMDYGAPVETKGSSSKNDALNSNTV